MAWRFVMDAITWVEPVLDNGFDLVVATGVACGRSEAYQTRNRTDLTAVDATVSSLDCFCRLHNNGA